MSTEVMKINEKAITPFLQPKQSDLVQMIGEIALKKETSFAIQTCQSNSLLMQASPASVAKCIWNIAITGLTLNPVLKFAYITPRNIGGAWEAVLVPSYQGLVKLLTDTGSVVSVHAHPVYKGDHFKVSLGDAMTLEHEPAFKTSKPEDITHFYAVATLHNGAKQFEVMTVSEVNAIRDKSDGYKAFASGKAKSAIWVDHYAEMGRKTVVKRIAKYVPKTDQNKWEKVSQAIEIDNSEYPASEGQRNYIGVLLQNSAYDHETRALIESKAEGDISIAEAENIITDLQNNQLNPITHGGNYNQTDIKKQVEEHV